MATQSPPTEYTPAAIRLARTYGKEKSEWLRRRVTTQASSRNLPEEAAPTLMSVDDRTVICIASPTVSPGQKTLTPMHLTQAEAALNTQLSPMDADLHTYGFPPGYFIIRSVASRRNLDVEMGSADDGTNVILWPETENSLVESVRNPSCDNQVFFVDTSGALCCRRTGHAIDVENDRLVMRHRRPVSYPFPNAYSHPLPRFSYDRDTRNITVTFSADPTYPPGPGSKLSPNAWKENAYLLTSIPARKSRSIMDDASDLLNNAIHAPLSLFGSLGKSRIASTPDEVFYSGHFDLREEEILEQDRSEEGEVDDSLERLRKVRVLALAKEEVHAASQKAKLRRQWVVVSLKASKTRTNT
ncbi:uncharacterized protein FIBRA_00102 [Fibroporia radiculosa]|uniref:Uncharacterized protein n=1 Tax=Fibroporia radiculosa TaxID=599839 RepID=J7SCG5_9APHY|nr:uncharacterized protein FIBRA_00102 [Fibroporia radiculosa]CCL98108.1 predicted protein [Fibroporia radiculosa]